MLNLIHYSVRLVDSSLLEVLLELDLDLNKWIHKKHNNNKLNPGHNSN